MAEYIECIKTGHDGICRHIRDAETREKVDKLQTFVENVSGYNVEEYNHLKNTVESFSNPNLLINGDFRVNQRGQTTYGGTANKFCVDRWKLQEDTLSYDVATKTFTNTSTEKWGYFYQKLEDSSLLIGKTVTMSAKVDGVIYSKTVNIPSTLSNGSLGYLNIPKGNMYLNVYSDGLIGFVFGLKSNSSEIVEYVKLEFGSIVTPFTPRPYGEELEKCKRYFQNIWTTACTWFARSESEIRAMYRIEMRTKPTISPVNIIQLYSPTRNANAIQTSANINFNSGLTNEHSVFISANNFTGLINGEIFQALTNEIVGTLDAEIY